MYILPHLALGNISTDESYFVFDGRFEFVIF